MSKPEPFDPNDPFDAITDDFRKQVVEMAARAFETPQFLALDAASKMAAVIGGTLTGLMNVVLTGESGEARDALVDYIVKDALPFALKQAEAMESSLNGEKT